MAWCILCAYILRPIVVLEYLLSLGVNNTSSIDEADSKRQLCCQAGYLPVPLMCIPADSLVGLDIYLANKDGYSLYSAIKLKFGEDDAKRLLDGNIEFVYISVHDHQRYYRAIEESIEKIVSEPTILQAKKCDILYATSIELSNRLLSAPPEKDQVDRAANLAKATVHLIMRDHSAFSHFYETFNHDFYTASHLVNICGLSISLGQKMGLVDSNILQQIGTGGLLHDIGKIFIPKDILNFPGKLTHQQYEIVKTHVDRGREHLEKVMYLTPEIASLVTEHHERMDGSGYPRGLKHEKLSPLGRLAGIVDVFDAMTSVRPFRSSVFSVAEALQQIEDASPEKFDIELVHAFCSLMESSLGKVSSHGGSVLSKTIDASGRGLKHLQYYFRMPIAVRRLKKVGDRTELGSAERVVLYKLSCLDVGLLSDRPLPVGEPIVICSDALKGIGLDRLVAIVSDCQDHSDGWYTVECRFQKPQSASAVVGIKRLTSVREISPLLAN